MNKPAVQSVKSVDNQVGASHLTLGELIAEVDRLEESAADFTLEASVLVLRNVTMEGIEPFLKHRLLACGIRPKLTYGGYGSVRQDLVGSQSLADKAKPDVLVLCLMLDELDPSYGLPGWSGTRAQDELKELFAAVAASGVPTLVVNTFIPPFRSETGFQVSKSGRSLADEVSKLNQFIRQHVRDNSPRFCLVDWERLVRLHGEHASMDYRYGYISKAPFKRALLDSIAQELTNVLRSLKGLAKKCLILDCDNTLWGGVVGEDGIEGIRLDGHDYPGKAFYDFQKSVLQLADRGVLIVLCSKNNEADVFEVLDKHPWCLIKRSHLSGFRINWEDKATNISALAADLNLGLDSFVFVDDNAAELELVRQMLPKVTTLMVPERLYAYPALLLRDGLFDTLTVSQEDRQRAALYQGEAQRKAARNQHVDLNEYLASMAIEAAIHLASPSEVARVAQLTQKTNQFNLTTRRYSDHDIESFRAGPDSAVFTLAASDRFGSLGLVGVLILKHQGGQALFDTLLMSCRALGRGLETAFVLECMDQARARWDVSSWDAEYLPTQKNSQVARFWDGLGFTLDAAENGVKRYRLDAPESTVATPGYLKIQRI